MQQLFHDLYLDTFGSNFSSMDDKSLNNGWRKNDRK